MAETSSELHPCACGCGELVRGTFKRGHASRMKGRVTPMPPPGSDFDALAAEAEPFGDTVDIDAPTPPGASEPPPSGQQPPTPLVRVRDQEDGGGPEGPDEPPAHAREPRRRRAREDRETAGSKKLPRITVATRSDIEGKISFALEIPGRVWQARDPICGTTFVEQRPEIASALTEIVCQSPDLIAWFTGAGGQFMLWLNLAAACWPVATMALAHHVYHSVALEEGPPPGYGPVQQPDYSRYAALGVDNPVDGMP